VKAKPTHTKRKRKDEDAEDLGFENSGDEAIIGEGVKEKKRRRKKAKAKGKTAEELDDEEEGGEGGLIKTRSMRAQEYEVYSVYGLEPIADILRTGKWKRNPSPIPQQRLSTLTQCGQR